MDPTEDLAMIKKILSQPSGNLETEANSTETFNFYKTSNKFTEIIVIKAFKYRRKLQLTQLSEANTAFKYRTSKIIYYAYVKWYWGTGIFDHSSLVRNERMSSDLTAMMGSNLSLVLTVWPGKP